MPCPLLPLAAVAQRLSALKAVLDKADVVLSVDQGLLQPHRPGSTAAGLFTSGGAGSLACPQSDAGTSVSASTIHDSLGGGEAPAAAAAAAGPRGQQSQQQRQQQQQLSGPPGSGVGTAFSRVLSAGSEDVLSSSASSEVSPPPLQAAAAAAAAAAMAVAAPSALDELPEGEPGTPSEAESPQPQAAGLSGRGSSAALSPTAAAESAVAAALGMQVQLLAAGGDHVRLAAQAPAVGASGGQVAGPSGASAQPASSASVGFGEADGEGEGADSSDDDELSPSELAGGDDLAIVRHMVRLARRRLLAEEAEQARIEQERAEEARLRREQQQREKAERERGDRERADK